MKEKIKKPLACVSILFFLSAAVGLGVVSDLQAMFDDKADSADSADSDRRRCDPKGKSLENLVVPQPQKTNKWCWAAVAEMVMARYGDYAEQCVQVTDAYRDEISVRSCCDDNNRWLPECNRSGWPHFSAYNFHVETNYSKKSGIEWKEVMDEICHDRPFIFTLEQSVDGINISHQYVAIGYKESLTRGKEILVINPMGYYPTEPDRGWWLFDEDFRKDPKKGVWHSGTLLNIHPK